MKREAKLQPAGKDGEPAQFVLEAGWMQKEHGYIALLGAMRELALVLLRPDSNSAPIPKAYHYPVGQWSRHYSQYSQPYAVLNDIGNLVRKILGDNPFDKAEALSEIWGQSQFAVDYIQSDLQQMFKLEQPPHITLNITLPGPGRGQFATPMVYLLPVPLTGFTMQYKYHDPAAAVDPAVTIEGQE